MVLGRVNYLTSKILQRLWENVKQRLCVRQILASVVDEPIGILFPFRIMCLPFRPELEFEIVIVIEIKIFFFKIQGTLLILQIVIGQLV